MAKQEFAVQARAKVPRDAYETLNVSSALTGEEEEVVTTGPDEAEIIMYRRLKADSEEDARKRAKNGKLLTDVPHDVEEIMKVRNLDEPL